MAYADNLIISAVEDLGLRTLDKYDDMSATMVWTGGLRTAIVRGMPYATVWYENLTPHLKFGSKIRDISGSPNRYLIELENGQTWIIYFENSIGY